MQTSDPVRITAILEDLKSTEPKVKSEAVKQINTVAVALGRDRAKTELMTFLNGLFNL